MTFFILIDNYLPLEVGEQPAYNYILYNKMREIKKESHHFMKMVSGSWLRR